MLENYIPEPNSGCWIWLGAVSPKGYGNCAVPHVTPKRWTSAHRRQYWETKGPIPDGLVIRHKCGLRLCINPDHLETGTQSENEHDKKKHGTFNNGKYQRSDVCKRGHALYGSEADVWIEKNGRPHCKPCRRLRYKKER